MLSGEQLELSFGLAAPQLRVCSSCDQPKPSGEFTKHNKGRCRDCIRAYKRALYAKNESFRERIKAKALKRMNEIRDTEEGREILNARKRDYRASEKGKAATLAHRETYKPRARELKKKYARQKREQTAEQRRRRKLTQQQCAALKRRIRDRLERNRLHLRAALHDWFCIEASNAWLDDWYSRCAPNITDHRKTDAEKYVDRYWSDKAFREKEKARRRRNKKACGIHDYNAILLRKIVDGESCGTDWFGALDVMYWYQGQCAKHGIEYGLMRSDVHVDHIIPKHVFNSEDEREMRDCWSLENLQLLWGDENYRKSNKCYQPDCDPKLWSAYGERVRTSLVVSEPVWLRKYWQLCSD